MTGPQKFRATCYTLEGLNSFATVIYFNYLYFFFRHTFGFDNKHNLALAAGIGVVYTFCSWQSGRLAARYGYFTALKLGFGLMAAGLLVGAQLHTAAGVIATAMPDAQIDIYLGSGGAPEGVLSAAALRCVEGQMQGRLLYESEEQVERVRAMGHADPKRCFTCEEMAKGDVMFAASGVTSGAMLRGVKRTLGGAITHSIVMRSHSGTVRYIEAHHNFVQKTWTPT